VVETIRLDLVEPRDQTLSENEGLRPGVQGARSSDRCCRRGNHSQERDEGRDWPPQSLDREGPSSKKSSAGHCNHHFFPRILQ